MIPRSWYLRNDLATSCAEPTSHVVPAPGLAFPESDALLGGVTDERRDPQSELQRRMLATDLGAERRQTFDPLAHAVERLAPEQLDVGLGSGNALGGCGRSPEVQRRMPAITTRRDARCHRGIGDLKVLAAEGDVLLRPELADQLQELCGPAVAVCLIAFAVTVGSQVVLAGDDVHPHPPLGEVIESRCRRSEMRGLP